MSNIFDQWYETSPGVSNLRRFIYESLVFLSGFSGEMDFGLKWIFQCFKLTIKIMLKNGLTTLKFWDMKADEILCCLIILILFQEHNKPKKRW